MGAMGFEPPTLNLFEKLRARERAAARPGAHVHRSRAFYDSVFPNHTVRPAPPTRLSARRTHDTTHRLDLPGAPRAEPAATRFVRVSSGSAAPASLRRPPLPSLTSRSRPSRARENV